MTANAAVQRLADETLTTSRYVTSHFTIDAMSDPSSLPRILENFALRNLVPETISVVKTADQLHIELVISDLCPREARHLEIRMQNIIPVLSVRLEIV